MVTYLSIISKSNFVDLYKYGYFFIGNCMPFEKKMNELSPDDLLFVLKSLNPFEYSFEYLVIVFQQSVYCEGIRKINIQDVKKIYVFNEEAKREMSLSFDQRIKLNVLPVNIDLFNQIQKEFEFKQRMTGVENIWKIFQLSDEDFQKCSEIIKEEDLRMAIDYMLNGEYPEGRNNISIWTYILLYQRHALYEQGTLGYFSDFIHICCEYSKKQKYPGEVAEETDVYKLMKDRVQSSPNPLNVADLLSLLEESPLSRAIFPSEAIKAGPLFFVLKDKMIKDGLLKVSEKDYKEKGTISYTKNTFKLEGSLAVFLFGFSLGFAGTRDVLYELNGGIDIFTDAQSSCSKVTPERNHVSLESQKMTDFESIVDEECEKLRQSEIIGTPLSSAKEKSKDKKKTSRSSKKETKGKSDSIELFPD